MSKLKKRLLIGAWLISLVVAGYLVFDYYQKSQANAASYETLRTLFDKGDTATETAADTGQTAELTARFEAIVADTKNEEIVGWLKIPGTAVDYPVVKAADNSFYLKTNVYQKSDAAGAIFMDYRNSGELDELNTILYGHNMLDGSMFAPLLDYKEVAFWQSHPTIEYYTKTQQVDWEIFAVYATDTEFYYIETLFPETENYQTFLESLKAKSLYDTGVEVTPQDRILTLSTCYNELNDGRFVIQAKAKE